MNISRQIQEIYEKLPYPPVYSGKRFGHTWRLAPMEWIEAMWQPTQPNPRRILIAGCGTGNEAFAFRRRFPNAEIVGIDFSARSLSIARHLQRRFSSVKPIRFVRVDMTSHRFRTMVGEKFDLISCHGVLSYLPRPEHVLRNFTQRLTTGGALYLGVNGVRHFSEQWRYILPEFGFDPNKFKDAPGLQRILKLCDALSGHDVGWIARKPAEYLASDLFGPLIRNLPLRHWKALCRQCGLHFLGSYSAHASLRPALNNDLYEIFIPRSRAEVHDLVERIAPSPFHYLIFGLRPPPKIPWHSPDLLKRCRISSTRVYTPQWPKKMRSWKALRRITIKSRPTNTLVELRVPEWTLEILRQSDSQLEIGQILREALSEIAPASLRRHSYLAYLLTLINLHPPNY